MAEYIEREATIARIKKYALDVYDIDLDDEKQFAGKSLAENYCEGLYEATEWVDDIPSADVVPVVHGRWERSENESNDEAFSLTDEEAWYYWKCSVCHEDICYHDAPMGRSFLPKYCPNCGARCDL